MKTAQEVTDVLNDLVLINNDRIEGYNRAIDDAADIDTDLQSLFGTMKSQSAKLVSELNNQILQLGGEPTTGTTVSGKIYRAWMDVKATFTGKDREALLSACEYGEDAAQKAYKEALATEGIPVNIQQFISEQKSQLKASHDEIKRLRDLNKAKATASL